MLFCPGFRNSQPSDDGLAPLSAVLWVCRGRAWGASAGRSEVAMRPFTTRGMRSRPVPCLDSRPAQADCQGWFVALASCAFQQPDPASCFALISLHYCKGNGAISESDGVSLRAG